MISRERCALSWQKGRMREAMVPRMGAEAALQEGKTRLWRQLGDAACPQEAYFASTGHQQREFAYFSLTSFSECQVPIPGTLPCEEPGTYQKPGTGTFAKNLAPTPRRPNLCRSPQAELKSNRPSRHSFTEGFMVG